MAEEVFSRTRGNVRGPDRGTIVAVEFPQAALAILGMAAMVAPLETLYLLILPFTATFER